MFNCGIILCNIENVFEYTCTVYFNNWYTLMDFYKKTIYREDNICSIVYTHPIKYKNIISEKFKIPYLKLTRKPKYFFENKKNIENIFLDGCVHITFKTHYSLDYIRIMQKVKEYCYNNNFYVFYRDDWEELNKLSIFDGLDNNLSPIFKEIKTEGMF